LDDSYKIQEVYKWQYSKQIMKNGIIL
jgi:hypothetical protein